MNLFKPIHGLINLVLGFSVCVLATFEAFIIPSVCKYTSVTGCKRDAEPEDIDSSNAECPTPPPVPTKEMKRIKLLLDIMISPGGTSVVNVATKNVMDASVPRPSILEYLVSRLSSVILTVIQTVKRDLLWLNYKLTGERRTEPLQCSHSPSSNGYRRTKSPKRRISLYKRITGFPFRMFGLDGRLQFDDCTLSLPQDHESESSNTLNNSRSQLVEKRKRADEDSPQSSEACCSSDDEETISRKTPVVDTPEDKVDDDSDSSDENFEETVECGTEGTYQPCASLTKRLIDITEEEYESAEDPDYVVSQEEIDDSVISSTSSEDEAHLFSESDTEKELYGLRAEALQHLLTPEAVEAQSPLDKDEHLAENPSQVPENDEDRRELVLDEDEEDVGQPNGHEYEYTDAQVSEREQPMKDPRLRQFYGSESGASSPFSINSSEAEPSVPNTPRSYLNESSHEETP